MYGLNLWQYCSEADMRSYYTDVFLEESCHCVISPESRSLPLCKSAMSNSNNKLPHSQIMQIRLMASWKLWNYILLPRAIKSNIDSFKQTPFRKYPTISISQKDYRCLPENLQGFHLLTLFSLSPLCCGQLLRAHLWSASTQ